MQNWIEGRNPFKLAEPSAWWLQLLFDYDPLLVVMPSVKDCAYRLCRRVPRHARLGNLVKYLHTHPDTVQMIQHGLVPVSTLTSWAIRSDKIIRDLMARDVSAAGGGEAALKVIEASEARALERKNRAYHDDLNAVNGEAYRSLKFRKGEAVSMRDVNRGRGKAGRLDKSDHKTVSSPRTPAGLVMPIDPATSTTVRPTTQIVLTDPA